VAAASYGVRTPRWSAHPAAGGAAPQVMLIEREGRCQHLHSSHLQSFNDAAMIDSVFDERLITHDNPSSVNKEEDKVKSSSLDGDDNNAKGEVKDAASELKTNSFVPPEAKRNDITLEDGRRDVQFVLPINSDGTSDYNLHYEHSKSPWSSEV